MKLYSGPLSMFGAKVEIALNEKGIAHELEMVPFDLQRLYEPRHPEVVRINPKRQVPVLIDGDLELFDSTQIIEYLEDMYPGTLLWPANPKARARARQLEHMSDEVYFPHIIRLMGLQDRHDDAAAIAARAGAAQFYASLEVRLAAQDFLAGTFSHADIAFVMAQFFGERMGAPLGPDTPRLAAWRQRIYRRDSVRAALQPMAAYLASVGRPAPAVFVAMLAA
jgi:glutathione S-transferase